MHTMYMHACVFYIVILVSLHYDSWSFIFAMNISHIMTRRHSVILHTRMNIKLTATFQQQRPHHTHRTSHCDEMTNSRRASLVRTRNGSRTKHTCTFCTCFIALGEAGVCGNEDLMSLNHKHYGSPCVYKAG